MVVGTRLCGFLALLIVSFASSLHHGSCKTFYVGNNSGADNWDLPTDHNYYQTWADSIDFYVSDVLSFSYNESLHDVLLVPSEAELDSCTYDASTYVTYDRSGNTSVYFNPPNSTENAYMYVMSSWYGVDCVAGMKFKLLVKPNMRDIMTPSPTSSILANITSTSLEEPEKKTIIAWRPQTQPDWYIDAFSQFTINSFVEFQFDGPFHVVEVDTQTHFDNCDSTYAKKNTLQHYNSLDRIIFQTPGDYFFVDKNFTNCNNLFMKITWTVHGPAMTGSHYVNNIGTTMNLAVVIPIVIIGFVIVCAISTLLLWHFTLKKSTKCSHHSKEINEFSVESPWVIKAAHRREFINTMMARAKGSNVCKIFTFQELKEATENFNDDKVIGCGGFGTVYKGILGDGTIVAIKRTNHAGTNDLEQFINEVSILSQVNNRNLVKLLGCCVDPQVPILVYEYICNGTLQDHLGFDSNLLDWGKRFKIALQTAEALKYLHVQAAKPIFHRDVKSANILLDGNFNAKVADFGLSKLVDLGTTHILTQAKGTFGYMDPEYHQTSQLTDKADVYSFGVVLLELITSQKPMDITRPGSECQNLALKCIPLIQGGKAREIIDARLIAGKNYEEISIIEGVSEVALACLGSARETRPSMSEVVNMLENLRGPSLRAIEFTRYELERLSNIELGAQTQADYYHLLGLQSESSDNESSIQMNTNLSGMSSSSGTTSSGTTIEEMLLVNNGSPPKPR